MWGIIPAAGVGSRIQPLAFSKELLPVGTRMEGGLERPRAVSEHLIDRMIMAGVDKICFVIAPGKADIINYYGARIGPASIAYVMQDEPAGLCDAIFRAVPFVRADEPVLVGLPDTVWFPEDGLALLPNDELCFLLFPTDHPEYFDAVATDATGRVEEVQVKRKDARSDWIWGAFKMPGQVLHALYALWRQPGRGDEYIGSLVNAWLAAGGTARGIRGGEVYVDVGTLHGWRQALELLDARPRQQGAALPLRMQRQGTAVSGPASRADQPVAVAGGALRLHIGPGRDT
jgi:glucose-1-phosphate thymidylyltransferase